MTSTTDWLMAVELLKRHEPGLVLPERQFKSPQAYVGNWRIAGERLNQFRSVVVQWTGPQDAMPTKLPPAWIACKGREAKHWDYKVRAGVSDLSALLRFLVHGRDDPVEPRVDIRGGGFASSKARREIEEAAIRCVKGHLKKRGLSVEDRQRYKLGYDLYASKGEETIYAEVKGTDATVARFFITRAERRFASREPQWRLYVVLNARTSPLIRVFTSAQMEEAFEFDSLAWECTNST